MEKSFIKPFVVSIFMLLPVAAMAAIIQVPEDQPTIQDGIDIAADGDLVMVAPGTYVENILIVDKDITVQSQCGPNITIIDGNEEPNAVFINLTDESILDGFTIQNGFQSGICSASASPRIENCIVKENSNEDGSGGIFLTFSDPIIVNCTIFSNIAEYGGGICCQYSDPIVENCCIYENTAMGGAGLFLSRSEATVTNCTISGNTATNEGGGIYSIMDSNPLFTNCILWNNSAPVDKEVYYTTSLTPRIWYSDVEGGWPGTGNIDEDPLFVGGGDYHLTASSPCIDTGTDAGVIEDMDCETRPYGPGFDMGADEYVPPGPCFIGFVMAL